MPSSLLRPPAHLLAAALVASLASAQTTVTIPCAKDNTLYEDPTGSLSSGSGPALFVGVTGQPGIRRALLLFDVAAVVPAGARVVAARLSITTVQSAYAGPVDVSGYRLLRAWGEGASIAPGGGGGGGVAAANDATWLHTFYPSQFWTNAGGDYAAVPSLVVTTQPFGTALSAPSARSNADVQSWLDNPAGNHGWLLRTVESTPYVSRKIDSRETVFGTPPSLTVSYLLPGQTGTHGVGCPVGTQPFGHALTGPFSGGTTVALTQSNGPPNRPAVNVLSLAFDPLGVALVPGCRFHLPPGPTLVAHSVVTLDATGGATTAFALPTGYAGVAIFAQTAALDVAGTGFVLSNASIGVLQ